MAGGRLCCRRTPPPKVAPAPKVPPAAPAQKRLRRAARGLAQGAKYPYALRTHCGIQGLYADGRYWVPVAGQDVGDHNPPAGSDESVEIGTLVNVEPGSRVEFHSGSGKVIVFEPGAPPSGECN